MTKQSGATRSEDISSPHGYNDPTGPDHPDGAEQSDAPTPQTGNSPCPIGLALGGGVARGWAHIGVLQRLDELGLRPMVVAGTSVGALVGGYWLAGKLDELEEWARSLTKRRMLGQFDVMLSGAGLIGGKRLREALSASLGDLKIEDLDTPFVAVTTELSSGHERWLRTGPIVDAVEAAYALPGVFPPRQIGGRWLIDGALVNPMPVSVCRALDAQVVVAVGLHADALSRASAARREKYDDPLIDETDLASAERLSKFSEKVMLRRIFRSAGPAPGLGSVMLSSFNIVMDRITRSRLAGDPPDIQITPQAGHVGLFDFDRADELITLGREAVDYALPRMEQILAAHAVA